MGLRTIGNLLGYPVGGLRTLQCGELLFFFISGFCQGIAPNPARLKCGLFLARNQRQLQHLACKVAGAGVPPKALHGLASWFGFCSVRRILRRSHHRVNHLDHALGIAPCVVAAEHVAAQALAYKGLRSYKYLWLCAAKSVNALLWVAHNENTWVTAASS